jgi:hypothetical protein
MTIEKDSLFDSPSHSYMRLAVLQIGSKLIIVRGGYKARPHPGPEEGLS